jgi:hypothetical protein
MRDWKSLVGIILVFVLGGLAGAFISLAVVHHRTTVILKRGSLAYEQMLEWHLSHGLNLDPGQRDRFHQAFMSNIEERKEIQAQIQPQMRTLNEQTGQEIRSILTPDQLLQFRHNLADFRRRFGAPGFNPRALQSGSPSAQMTNEAAGEIGTNSAPTPDQL